MERDAAAREVVRQHVGRKARLFLIQINRDEVEVDRRPAPERQEYLKQPIAVFPAGKADHDLIAVLDHAIIGDGLADQPAEPGFQLFDVVAESRLTGDCG